MAKTLESFRLEPSHLEMIKLRTADLRIKKTDYIRLLIERDNLGRFQKPSLDEWTSWQQSRAAITLSDSQIALLQAIKKEFGKEENFGKAPKNLVKLCEKYGLDNKVARSDLEVLVKRNILSHAEDDNSKYVWTNEGIIILPEYAFTVPNSCPFISGDISSLLQKMFGNYWETIKFIQDALKVSKKDSKQIFKVVLGEHKLFLRWLRDFGFDMTGIANTDDVAYYRKQMMNFLMSYSLMVRDSDFIDTNDEFRALCNHLVKKLSNYFKK